jgi:hypothetical protein
MTNTEQFLDGLTAAERDHIADLARDAAAIVTSDRRNDASLYLIFLELQPLLEAMVKDGYEGAQAVTPVLSKGFTR